MHSFITRKNWVEKKPRVNVHRHAVYTSCMMNAGEKSTLNRLEYVNCGHLGNNILCQNQARPSMFIPTHIQRCPGVPRTSYINNTIQVDKNHLFCGWPCFFFFTFESAIP